VVAATLMPFFIIMCETMNGILQPHKYMPAFWAYTMYYVTPFTYWIGGVLTSVLRGVPVICDESELTVFQSPPNITCSEYAGPWLAEKGVGYLSNPDGSGECGYCEYSYGDDVRSVPFRFRNIQHVANTYTSTSPRLALIRPRSGRTLAFS
jgi:ABC-type multidrug transport system permease subunit